MELMLNGRFPRLESTGIHFDDLGKIRILEEETRSQAAELRSTCDDFLKSVTELRKISDSIVAIFDSVSKEVEREKISAIGARNLLRTASKNRESKLQQLSSLIVEKQIISDRLAYELSALQSIEWTQNDLIDQFVLKRFEDPNDVKLDLRTKQLFQDWQRIERRAESLRKETERLRQIKDEAKRIVQKNFPNLFQDLDEDSSESSSSTLASSAEEDLNLSFGRVDGGSKDLQDAFNILQNIQIRKDSLQNSQNDFLQKVKHQKKQQRTLKSPATAYKDGGHLLNLMSELQFENGTHFRDNGDRITEPNLKSPGPQQQQPQYGFIPMPVDFETYQKWISSLGQAPGNLSGYHVFPQMKEGQNIVNENQEATSKKVQQLPVPVVQVATNYKPDAEDSEDTSQDAADLVSSNELVPQPKEATPASQPVITEPKNKTDVVKVVPRSRFVLPKSSSIESETSLPQPQPKNQQEKSSVEKPKPLEVRPIGHPDRVEDDDTNFILESDNNDDNLYSSESSSTSSSSEKKSSDSSPTPARLPAQQVVRNPFATPPSQTLQGHIVQQPLEKRQPAVAINLDSDSDSPAPVKPSATELARRAFQVTEAVEADISGPENELDDDNFWN